MERPAVINLTKTKRRTLQPYQAYMNICKDEIMPIIARRYKRIVDNTPKGVPIPDRFSFTIEAAKDMLANEPPAIREAVERARFDVPNDNEDEEEVKLQNRQR